jgi:coenzyme F420-reducing hydrogenase gamma subunit
MGRFLSQLLLGAEPMVEKEKLCMQCKRQQTVCVLVTKQAPCLGPVTRTGCGAMCPSYGKACYSCYGPSEQPNCRSLSNRLQGLGMVDKEIAHRFAQFHSHAPVFHKEIEHWAGNSTGGENK